LLRVAIPVQGDLMTGDGQPELMQVEFAPVSPGAKTSGRLILHSENIDRLD
jgi:hypothetical protein